jgi:putative ABC transport system permease protein
VRQVLAESVLLALAGGGLGVLLAHAGVVALVSLAPAGLPRLEAVRLDGGVFILALAVVVLLGLAVGLIPAFHAARVDPVSGWHSGNRTISGRHHTIRRGLVVAEVALAMILLVGAGLLLRSLQRIFAIPPGFEPRDVLAMQVHASGRRYDAATALNQFFQQALDAVRQVPGVEAAGFTSQLPLSGDLDRYGVQFESAPTPPGDEGDGVFRYGVTPGYIEALGIPLIRGRLLDEGDRPGAPVAVLISQSYARRRFPDRDPVGQRLHLGSTDQPWYTIVGVVGDVRQTALGVEEADAVYLPAQQWYAGDRVQSLVVRTRGDAAALTPAVRNAIWSVDKDQAITRVVTMNDLVTGSEAERRFALVLLQSFALVALALAAIGIYGVVSGGVTERVREIGVRSALGASRTGILSLVVRQGMTLAGLGIGLGLAAALGASRGLEALLFGVSRLDPLTYLSVAFLSALVALAATAIPARRASRVDPAIALRAE